MMTELKQHTAFIFARGGSKGVKDKNIRPLAGKPLIAHSIECAYGSRYIKNVVVSTDSQKIAAVATSHGATVLERPKELAGDSSPELLSWHHAIEQQGLLHEENALFISLPATSPLRASSDVDEAIETFSANKCDILFGISPSQRNPYLNMVTINNDNLIDIVNAGADAARRQDVPPVYDVTTCVYIGNPGYIMSCEKLMQGKVGYSIIPVERALDIDTEYDLHLAGLLLANPFSKAKERCL